MTRCNSYPEGKPNVESRSVPEGAHAGCDWSVKATAKAAASRASPSPPASLSLSPPRLAPPHASAGAAFGRLMACVFRGCRRQAHRCRTTSVQIYMHARASLSEACLLQRSVRILNIRSHSLFRTADASSTTQHWSSIAVLAEHKIQLVLSSLQLRNVEPL